MRDRSKPREKLYEAGAYHGLLALIGANVRRVREERGWTQEEAAEHCGEMASQLLCRIELGATNVTALSLSRIVEGFGIEPAELLKPVVAPPAAHRGPGRPRKPAPVVETAKVAPAKRAARRK